MIKEFQVSNQENVRLDVYLSLKLTEFTRSKIKKMIDENLITVNNQKQKAGYIVQQNDKITVDIKEELGLNANPENIDIDIIFENENMLVVNKKQGMCVHPAVGNFSGTLVNALAYHVKNLSTINGEFRPGIVHRLDKDTSGLLIIAKNDIAHKNLAKQIENKTCKRYYVAVLEGNLKQEQGVVETFLTRSEKDRKKYEVSTSKGKFAITNYKVLERYNGFCLVEFELKTGRTHQIRVHARHLGHPVVGDKLYGFNKHYDGINGQLLHAYKIEFNEPQTNERICLQVDIPTYFKNFIKKLTQAD